MRLQQAMDITPLPQESRPPGAEQTLRLFIALWPPPALAAALHARGAQLIGDAPARREAAERLHLTLHFLGAVPRSRLPALQAVLGQPFEAFEMAFGGCTRWPSGVVVAEPVDPPPGLRALHAAQAQALAALGLRTESRAFRPHVTLARRHTGPWHAEPAGEAVLRWRVRRCVLVESLPGPPARYRVVARGPAPHSAHTPEAVARAPRQRR